MVDRGNDARDNDRASSQDQPGVTDTTSIQLPPVHAGPSTVPVLAADARFLLDSQVTTAGRHPDADIFLDDVTVSRRHVNFMKCEGGFEVIDAGSLNGTYVNGDRVDSVRLNTGNEVQIGKFRLTYYFSSNAAVADS